MTWAILRLRVQWPVLVTPAPIVVYSPPAVVAVIDPEWEALDRREQRYNFLMNVGLLFMFIVIASMVSGLVWMCWAIICEYARRAFEVRVPCICKCGMNPYDDYH
jgi:hypothetical protein